LEQISNLNIEDPLPDLEVMPTFLKSLAVEEFLSAIELDEDSSKGQGTVDDRMTTEYSRMSGSTQEQKGEKRRPSSNNGSLTDRRESTRAKKYVNNPESIPRRGNEK
jgi:hypothetical protein